MEKLKIVYPVITFNAITIEVDEEEAERIITMNLKDQAEYIGKLNDQQDLPDLYDEKLCIGALDTEYATIKRIIE